MASSRSFDAVLVTVLAGMLVAGIPRIGVSQNVPVDACRESQISAYASHLDGQCFVYDRGTPEQRSALILNNPLHAGDQVECAIHGMVTITFCASGQDQKIRHSKKYVVPNVPARSKQETDGLSEALRHVFAPRQKSEGDLAQGNDSNAPAIPTCDRQLGRLEVREPEEKWWVAAGLESPVSTIKTLVVQSHCFALLEPTQDASRSELSLEDGEQRPRPDTRADYVLIPSAARDLYATADNFPLAGAIGSLLEAIKHSPKSAVSGGLVGYSVNARSHAEVELQLVEAPSTEIVRVAVGEARERAGLRQVMTRAYADALARLVADMKAARQKAAEDAASLYCEGGLSEGPGRGEVAQTSINSVRAARGTIVISVMSAPKGDPTLVVNGKTITGAGSSLRVSTRSYVDFSQYQITGSAEEMNLQLGANAVQVRYGGMSIPAYNLSCRR